MSGSDCHEPDAGDGVMNCVACGLRDTTGFRLRTHADYAEVLSHYLREHPDSPILADVLSGIDIEVGCAECGETLESGVDVENGELYAQAYCADCLEARPMRGLVQQEVQPSQAVANEVDDSGSSVHSGESRNDRDLHTGTDQ